MSSSAEKFGKNYAIDLAEFRRGWRVLILALIGVWTSVTVAPLYAFGSMIIPLQEAFGWSRSEIQPAISFLFAGSVISIQITGWLFNRYGMRSVTLCSLVALPLAYLLMTFNTGSIWQLYAGYALLTFAGLAAMPLTWTQLINLWFDVNRGLALAIILCGTGLATLTLPPLLTWAMEIWGWRSGFWLLAALPLLVTLPLSFFWLSTAGPLVQRVAAAKKADVASVELPGLTFGQSVRSRRLLICNIAMVLGVTATVGLVVNTVPLLRDKGLTASDAAHVFSLFGVSLVVGRVVIGYLMDRFWAPGVSCAALLLPALGCLIFMAQTDMYLLMLGSILIGIGAGAELDIASFLIARYFGMRDYARVYGLHMAVICVGSTLAPFGYAWLFAKTASYSIMLGYCTFGFAVGALSLLALGRYPHFMASSASSEGASEKPLDALRKGHEDAVV